MTNADRKCLAFGQMLGDSGAVEAGKNTRMRVPFPVLLSTSMAPSCPRTIE